jgi:hypothetical protein
MPMTGAAARARRMLHEASCSLALEKGIATSATELTRQGFLQWRSALGVGPSYKHFTFGTGLGHAAALRSEPPTAPTAARMRANPAGARVIHGRESEYAERRRHVVQEQMLARELAAMEAEQRQRTAHGTALRALQSREDERCASVREAVFVEELRASEAQAAGAHEVAALLEEMNEQRAAIARLAMQTMPEAEVMIRILRRELRAVEGNPPPLAPIGRGFFDLTSDLEYTSRALAQQPSYPYDSAPLLALAFGRSMTRTISGHSSTYDEGSSAFASATASTAAAVAIAAREALQAELDAEKRLHVEALERLQAELAASNARSSALAAQLDATRAAVEVARAEGAADAAELARSSHEQLARLLASERARGVAGHGMLPWAPRSGAVNETPATTALAPDADSGLDATLGVTPATAAPAGEAVTAGTAVGARGRE